MGCCGADRFRKYAVEFAALAPDVILASGSSSVGPLLQATRAVPIVFVNVPDPVGAGFVHSLARPGGNATGFSVFEYGIGSKWLELLKEIAPRVTRAAILRDPAVAAGPAEFAAIQAVAPSLGVELRPPDVRDAGEIKRTITAFAQGANGGLIRDRERVGEHASQAPDRETRAARLPAAASKHPRLATDHDYLLASSRARIAAV
jgi:putative ABC transport system substrate-binding protein